MTHDRLFADVYNAFEGSSAMAEFSDRHGIESQAVLTVTDDKAAHLIVDWLAPRIEGKTVVEIGGGIGLLSLHMGLVAKRVYCIEANAAWSWIFLGTLLHQKPKNVSFLFGSASEFAPAIKGDVAVFCTHSGVASMRREAERFAPEVIDVYGELIAKSPDKFDPFAALMRNVA